MNKSQIITFCFLFFSTITLAVQPEKMIVIVNDEQKSLLTGIRSVSSYLNSINSKFNIYSLDDVDNYEKLLSEGLPADEAKAQEIVNKKLDEIGEEKLKSMIITAYKANLLTLKYRLQKYPAIIFDDSVVVYGEFDLNIALNRYLEIEEIK